MVKDTAPRTPKTGNVAAARGDCKRKTGRVRVVIWSMLIQAHDDPYSKQHIFLKVAAIFPNNDIKCEVNKIRRKFMQPRWD